MTMTDAQYEAPTTFRRLVLDSPSNRYVFTAVPPLRTVDEVKRWLAQGGKMVGYDFDDPDLEIAVDVDFQDGRGGAHCLVIKWPTPKQSRADRPVVVGDAPPSPPTLPKFSDLFGKRDYTINSACLVRHRAEELRRQAAQLDALALHLDAHPPGAEAAWALFDLLTKDKD